MPFSSCACATISRLTRVLYFDKFDPILFLKLGKTFFSSSPRDFLLVKGQNLFHGHQCFYMQESPANATASLGTNTSTNPFLFL